jgi:DNA-binding transcriptional LysR family regulator
MLDIPFEEINNLPGTDFSTQGTINMQLLRDIELFVEVVHARSFSKAAQRLEMPTSTLSRRISDMERSLGLRLLNRTTRKVEVTEAGATYFARCAHLIDEARVAHENLSATSQIPQGTLRLACTPDFAALYLPDVLVHFAKAHPAVNVELDLSSRRIDLTSENVDAALRIGDLPDSGLVSRRLGWLQHQLFASPAYLRQHGVPDAPRDLALHAAVRIRPGPDGARWVLMDAAGRREAVTVQARFTAGSVAMARELALRGAGIVAIDLRAARDDVRAGRLQRVLAAWQVAPVPLHLVTASRLMPARVRVFAQALEDLLGAK